MALFRRENIAVPDDRKAQVVFKWPDVNIRRFTKAIVAPDEVAVFMYQGQVLGTLWPGQHTVDAVELPFLGLIKDVLTGGNAYRTELYFVSMREFPDLRFGGRIDDVQDPQTGLVVALRVFGEYSLLVKDGPSLIVTLTGTVNVTDNDAITDWIAQQLLKVLRTEVVTNIVQNGWPILGLAAYLPQLEPAVVQAVNHELEGYGLSIARLGNVTISLSEEDEATLKGLAKDTAYSRLAGSFQQYAAAELQLGAAQGMARGGAATGGAFLATGVGLGQQATAPGAAPAPAAPAPGPSPAAGSPAAAEPAAACPRCHAPVDRDARFCGACGATLAPATVECPACHSPNPGAARFCSHCGTALAAAPPPGPPPATENS